MCILNDERGQKYQPVSYKEWLREIEKHFSLEYTLHCGGTELREIIFSKFFKGKIVAKKFRLIGPKGKDSANKCRCKVILLEIWGKELGPELPVGQSRKGNIMLPNVYLS